MFDGWTYDPELDHDRLSTQLRRVLAVMVDGQWHTLSELADKAQGSEAGVSARLRDLRKEKFGSWDVERERLEPGKRGRFAYRLIPPRKQSEQLRLAL